MQSPPDLLTTAEAAEYLGVSHDTVTRMAVSGELPVAKKAPGIRGPRMFHRAEVERAAQVKKDADAGITGT